MTKKQVKYIIKTGNALTISQAIFKRWKLDKLPPAQKPYKDD